MHEHFNPPPMNKTENGEWKNILGHKLICDSAMRPMNDPEHFCIKHLKLYSLRFYQGLGCATIGIFYTQVGSWLKK